MYETSIYRSGIIFPRSIVQFVVHEQIPLKLGPRIYRPFFGTSNQNDESRFHCKQKYFMNYNFNYGSHESDWKCCNFNKVLRKV
jgi:hypothetical protein